MNKRVLRLLVALFLLPGSAYAEWQVTVTPEHLQDALELSVSELNLTDASKADVFVADATSKVKQTLEAFGYYDPEVSIQTHQNTHRLVVNAGPPVRLRVINIQVVGAAERDERFKPPAFPQATGDVLQHSQYESFKQQLEERALERGYFDSRWLVSSIEVNLQERVADVYLGFDSGERYQFGPISYREVDGKPLRALNALQLATLTPFKTGDAISSRQLFQLQKNLIETRYFREAQVSFRRDQTLNRQVPVEVVVDSRLPSLYSFGLGFATDVGPKLQGEWQRPLLNRQGHGVQVTTELAAARQSGEIRYRMPWKHPLEDRLEFALGLQEDRIEDTDSVQTVVSVQRVLDPRRGWQRSFGLRLVDERFQRDSGEKGAERILAPYASFNRVQSQGGIDPLRGTRLFFQTEFASQALVSTSDFVSLRSGFRWLNTYQDRHMLLIRGDAGAILSTDFERVSPSLRFYAGGDNSVRGFDFRSLSPRNSLNETIGGQYLLAASVEYNWRWRPTWRPAVFVDVGNAFSQASDANLGTGVGVGIRWISPVGPIRADLASAVSEPGAPLRLHLTIGSPL
ncbi:autotransporter assembly complex protein TamA [Perlucidibaca aquatica]|uniref:autotransporter assembly complex protein TamA n=1 Tax=Perlucidibaca aquatica TaxID=1852776 RepID=UPI00083B397F|nr:autotransporter assembly complex family protein [Perlucidibaca aquatica]